MASDGTRTTNSVGSRRLVRNRGAFCPSCERFIGPADTCPYCDADSAKRPVLRVLRYSALLLGMTGLAFLYLAVTHKELPVIRVGNITPMMNFAYVRVKGTVEKDAYIAKEKGEVQCLSFSLDDGSGQLRVAAYGNVARCLVEKDMVPKGGTLVYVAGSLNVSANGRVKLIMRE